MAEICQVDREARSSRAGSRVRERAAPSWTLSFPSQDPYAFTAEDPTFSKIPLRQKRAVHIVGLHTPVRQFVVMFSSGHFVHMLFE